jgi:hypothetical protein
VRLGHGPVGVFDTGCEAYFALGEDFAIWSSYPDVGKAIATAYIEAQLHRVRDHVNALGEGGVLSVVKPHGPVDLTRVAGPLCELTERITKVISAEWGHRRTSG